MKQKPAPEIELHPDAWQRFKRAVSVVMKAPPQHRVKASSKARAGKPSRKAKRKATTV